MRFEAISERGGVLDVMDTMGAALIELIRSTLEEKGQQIDSVANYQQLRNALALSPLPSARSAEGVMSRGDDLPVADHAAKNARQGGRAGEGSS